MSIFPTFLFLKNRRSEFIARRSPDVVLASVVCQILINFISFLPMFAAVPCELVIAIRAWLYPLWFFCQLLKTLHIVLVFAANILIKESQKRISTTEAEGQLGKRERVFLNISSLLVMGTATEKLDLKLLNLRAIIRPILFHAILQAMFVLLMVFGPLLFRTGPNICDQTPLYYVASLMTMFLGVIVLGFIYKTLMKSN
jgi:hypothetical protein